MKTYIDKNTGIEVTQLTDSGSNWHFYFTENSFTTGDNEIIYLHKDGSLRDDSIEEIYSLNLETGENKKLSDFATRFKKVSNFTKSPDSEFIVFIGDDNLYKQDIKTGELTLLYRCPVGYYISSPTVSFDKRYIALAANDIVEQKNVLSENYGGFKDNFFGHKNSMIIIVRPDGRGGDVVFEDTHWIGHLQFAPDTNEFLSFCHEGPWNYVQQRIWMLNTITRHVTPCFIQGEDDCVGHEFWTRDGLVFFDNRGKGHDGTITSDKTQAVTMECNDPDDIIPWVGFADKDCNIVKRINLPYYCNHYHANNDNSLLVADAVNDLVLIDISGDEPDIKTLCTHNTSWRWQCTHCHPTWSWSGDKILFASDGIEEGYPQLYMIKMK